MRTNTGCVSQYTAIQLRKIMGVVQLLAWFGLSFHLSMVQGNCGEIGTSYCVQIQPFYGNEYQWATCVSSTYIEAQGPFSNCRDSTVTSCLYQCMVERHNLDGGAVADDCKCTAGTNVIQTNSPAECQIPDGRSCSWFKQCLEDELICEEDVIAYAVDYGYMFCSLHENTEEYFSNELIEWIDKVRMCLQFSLVPYIRAYDRTSCNDIKDNVTYNQAVCYLNNGICTLNCHDWTTVVWTMKRNLEQNFTGAIKSLVLGGAQCALYDSSTLNLDSCLSNTAEEGMIRLLKLSFSVQSQNESDRCDADCVAERLQYEISQKHLRTQSTIDFVVLANKTSEGLTEAWLLLTDWARIRGTSNSNQLLEETTTELREDLESGQVRVELEGLRLEKVSVSSNIRFNETYPITEMPVSHGERIGGGRIVTGTVFGFYCLTCLLKSLLFL